MLYHSRLISDYWNWKYTDDAYFGIKDSKKWKIDDYIEGFRGIAGDQKSVYVVFVFYNRTLDESDKLTFSKYIIENSRRPLCIYAACEFIDRKANFNKDYLSEYKEYANWVTINNHKK